MACNKCSSNRIIAVSGKTSDMCYVKYDGKGHEGYVPRNLNIGSGDYLEFNLCLECGTVQGNFPVQEDIVQAELEG